MDKDLFDEWNDKKKTLHNDKVNFNFNQLDIFFMYVGKNIGFEQDGGKDFLRPVLVYKKFNSRIFLGIPLTTQQKYDKFHFEFEYKKGKRSFAILSQIRLFDIKRAFFRDGKISKKDFIKLQEKLLNLIITPPQKGWVRTKAICNAIISENNNFVKGKKIALITGGAGFVGSHLCERLVKKGYEVVSLDNYFTGSEKNHIDGVKYIKGDTKDIFELIDFTPDYIYHLGEYSRVEQSFEDIEIVYEYNKIGTFKVLEFVRKTGAKLIYAGSSTKFGDGGLGRSQSPYAWTKASNTELVINYGNWFQIPYAITYFYNVYGPREIESGKYATLIALFKNKMQKGEPLTIVSPGTQKRNFTHIDDIIDGLVKVGEDGFGDEFGIGSDEAFTILEVAEMFLGISIEDAIRENKLIMLPPRPGNRMRAEVMSEKTKKLGWSAKKKLVDYIEELRANNWE